VVGEVTSDTGPYPVIMVAVIGQTTLLLLRSTSVYTLKLVSRFVLDGTVTVIVENGLGLVSKTALEQGSFIIRVSVSVWV
jgi:hypothetical protein